MAFTPAVLAAAAAIGTVTTAIGSLVTANANASAQRYQAQVAERQRQINLLNADRALDAARQEQIQMDQQTSALLGSQIAAQSASGLKLGGRSQILTRKSARELGRLDALNISAAGDIAAYNYRVAAEDSGKESQFLRQSASNSMLTGWLSAGSTLIGGMQNFDFGVPKAGTVLGPRRYNGKVTYGTSMIGGLI